MMNVIHKFPGVLDADMNKELYLLHEAEITETEFNAVKEGYGVIGPDYQIIKRNGKFFLRGDMEIEAIKEIVNGLLADKGVKAAFKA